jgi:hypothetical protein
MQKKILSAVLSLLLVGSASSAFAGYYGGYDIDITKSVDVNDSFKDQSDDDGLDLDIKKSFNGNDNDGYDIDVKNSGNTTYNKTLDSKTDIKVNAQGNGVIGKFVVQQFGGAGGAGAGDVVNVDNSINHSTINSNNDTNSHNKTYTSNRNYTSTSNINNSFNKTHTSNRSLDLGIDVNVDKSQNFKAIGSFNGNRLGMMGPSTWMDN